MFENKSELRWTIKNWSLQFELLIAESSNKQTKEIKNNPTQINVFEQKGSELSF